LRFQVCFGSSINDGIRPVQHKHRGVRIPYSPPVKARSIQGFGESFRRRVQYRVHSSQIDHGSGSCFSTVQKIWHEDAPRCLHSAVVYLAVPSNERNQKGICLSLQVPSLWGRNCVIVYSYGLEVTRGSDNLRHFGGSELALIKH